MLFVGEIIAKCRRAIDLHLLCIYSSSASLGRRKIVRKLKKDTYILKGISFVVTGRYAHATPNHSA